MDHIFSGDGSKRLWHLINRINKKKSRKKRKRLARRIWSALYSITCSCQELESLVRKKTELK